MARTSKEDKGPSRSCAPEALIASLQRGEHFGCVLLAGEEEYTKRLALDAFKATVDGDFPEMNMNVLYDPAPDELIAAAETLPFMSARRLVIVRECTLLSGKVTQFDEDAAIKRLEAYLPHVPGETTVVFYVLGKADARRRMTGILQKCGLYVNCERLKTQAAEDWTRQAALARGMSIGGPAAALLVAYTGAKLDILSLELDKLLSYLDGRKAVTEQDVRDICTSTREARVFEMTNALFAGRGKQAFLILRQLRVEGEDAMGILSVLSDQCRRVYYAAEMLHDGKSRDEIREDLGIPPFAVQSTLDAGYGADRAMLGRMCVACTDLEYRVKSGQIMQDAALESMMLRILQLKAIAGRRRA